MIHCLASSVVRIASLALLASRTLAQWVRVPVPADTLRRQHLDEAVVTATRTDKNLTDVAIPVSVVGAKQIKSMGSLRLGDVLREQTGLSLVADYGQSIQLQGLKSEYTLILADGEPLIGRTADTLDLTRVAVGNIQRVAVVKGPASTLWGSDALAGVVNIITQKPQPGFSGSLRTRYGTTQTAELSATLNAGGERAGLTVFGNRYSLAGCTLQPESGTATVPPFASYTGQIRFTYSLSERTKFSLSGRYFLENQHSTTPTTTDAGTTTTIDYKSRQTDFNLNPTLTHRCGWRVGRGHPDRLGQWLVTATIATRTLSAQRGQSASYSHGYGQVRESGSSELLHRRARYPQCHYRPQRLLHLPLRVPAQRHEPAITR